MKFNTLELDEKILKGIDDAGFVRCTPIQEQALPECLSGKDMIAQSQTGSGKTAVFLLTIYSRLLKKGPSESGRPRALVMAPTRELALQIDTDAKIIGKHIDLKSIAVYGGVDYDKQKRAFEGGVDVIFATPGRLIDLYKSKVIDLSEIEVFVIDEADRMFDIGFAPDIRYIAGKVPKSKDRQMLLFSATIDDNVSRLANQFMRPDYATVEIEPEQVTVDTIDQKVIYVSNDEKFQSLMAILRREEVERVIIFTNMKRTTEYLEWKLKGNGFNANALTGDMTQSKRQSTINRMKSGKGSILVATDVVARGVHIDDVTHVINYDLPEDAANYVHRIGRTARAGKSGVAYSLACEDHVLNLPEIEGYIEHKLDKEWIEPEELPEDRAGSFGEYRRREARKKAKGERERSGSRSGPKAGPKGAPKGGSSKRRSEDEKEGGKRSKGQERPVKKTTTAPKESEVKGGREKGASKERPQKKAKLKGKGKDENRVYATNVRVIKAVDGRDLTKAVPKRYRGTKRDGSAAAREVTPQAGKVQKKGLFKRILQIFGG